MYQALYRKYRPQNFNEVVGQKHIIQTLKNAVDQNRIGHAYLFCGPRGTGKTTVAKIFAKMLNCTGTKERPCEECDNCQMFQRGNHPDIIEIDAASNNGVDEVRDLIERVKYAPMQGAYKVYIIDEVHMMSTGAFNALLKTIEEPPAHVIFIFATTEPNKVLPTIISRCQRFDFKQVSLDDIISRINAITKFENIQIEDEAVRLIAELSDGGMRDALSILDQCVAFCTSMISADDVRQIYGVLTTDEIGAIFYSLNSGNVEDFIYRLEKAEQDGMDLKRLTQDMIFLLKESLILDKVPKTDLVSASHKNVIYEKMMLATPLFRLKVLDELINTYNKYNYASSVLDYLETALLKTISDSYDNSERTQNPKKTSAKADNHRTVNTKSYDNSSEYSDIEEKTSEISEDNKSDIQIKSETVINVSRETSDEQVMDDEYILQLLVGANKKERQTDTEKMKDNSVYLSDLTMARFASSLRNCKIYASGSNYLVVGTRTEVEAKEINSLQREEGFESYTENLLGKSKVVFAIDKKQYDRVIRKFKERRFQGTLPDPVEVKIKVKEEQVHIESTEDTVKGLFPTVDLVDD